MDQTPPTTDLLMDILSVPAGRALSAKVLCSAGEILGFAENAVRVALTRLVQQKKIEKVGRAAYALHPSRLPLILDVADWRARLGRMTVWDGDWIAIADPVIPAVERTTKRLHDRALSLGGFRTWKPGLHLRPNNLIGGLEALRERIPALGLAGGAEFLSLHPLAKDQHDKVIALWNIAELVEIYRRLLKDLQSSEKRRSRASLDEAARESLLLGRNVISHLARDPLLPAELMPGGDRDALVAAINVYERESKRTWNTLLGLDP